MWGGKLQWQSEAEEAGDNHGDWGSGCWREWFGSPVQRWGERRFEQNDRNMDIWLNPKKKCVQGSVTFRTQMVVKGTKAEVWIVTKTGD